MSTPLPRASLADGLAESIVAMIVSDGLQPGDQLLTVRRLADRFEVAVPTVREALRRLEATKIVELRHGSGVYVGENLGRWVMKNPAAPKQPLPEQLANLLESRLIIEPSVAELAARRRVQEGLDRAATELAIAQAAIDSEDWERLAQVNMDLHQSIAAATGNPILAELVDSVTSVNARAQLAILHIHGHRQRDHDEHEAIYRAVLAGHSQVARTLMRKHIAGVLDVVRTRTGGSGRPRRTTRTKDSG